MCLSVYCKFHQARSHQHRTHTNCLHLSFDTISSGLHILTPCLSNSRHLGWRSSTEAQRDWVSRPPVAIPFLARPITWPGQTHVVELKSHAIYKSKAVAELHMARCSERKLRTQALQPDYIYFYLTDSDIFKALLHAKLYDKCSSNINSFMSHNSLRMQELPAPSSVSKPQRGSGTCWRPHSLSIALYPLSQILAPCFHCWVMA